MRTLFQMGLIEKTETALKCTYYIIKRAETYCALRCQIKVVRNNQFRECVYVKTEETKLKLWI